MKGGKTACGSGRSNAEGRVIVDDPEARPRAGGVRTRGYSYWRGTRAGRKYQRAKAKMIAKAKANPSMRAKFMEC
jgi:hypothetical protein